MFGSLYTFGYVSKAKTASNNLRETGSAVKDEDLAYTRLAGSLNIYESLNVIRKHTQ